MIYEIFGGRDTIIKNLMKQFDSDGDLLNANGVAGMDVTGKGTSWQKLTNVSEDHRLFFTIFSISDMLFSVTSAIYSNV